MALSGGPELSALLARGTRLAASALHQTIRDRLGEPSRPPGWTRRRFRATVRPPMPVRISPAAPPRRRVAVGRARRDPALGGVVAVLLAALAGVGRGHLGLPQPGFVQAQRRPFRAHAGTQFRLSRLPLAGAAAGGRFPRHHDRPARPGARQRRAALADSGGGGAGRSCVPSRPGCPRGP